VLDQELGQAAAIAVQARERVRLGGRAGARADLAEHAVEVAVGHREVGADLGDEQAVEGGVGPQQQHDADQRQRHRQRQQHHREQLAADGQPGEVDQEA
jgi:hypothetical protein